ncbi:MAG: cytochrome c class [Sphingobacteriales bacterium]|nr:cytochrome c class [Sphingobacteriales bacterium]
MRKIILVGSLALFFSSVCFFYSKADVVQTEVQLQEPKTAAAKKNVSKAGTKQVQTSASSTKEIEEGSQLLMKSDCLGCHKVQDKLVGPSFIEVSKKYTHTPANINLLTDKIVKGGSGVWGQIPMSPHPTLPVTDINKIVKYIFSLK